MQYSLHILKSVGSGSWKGMTSLMSVVLLAGRSSHNFLAGNILEKEAGSQKVIREVLGSEKW